MAIARDVKAMKQNKTRRAMACAAKCVMAVSIATLAGVCHERIGRAVFEHTTMCTESIPFVEYRILHIHAR